MPALKIAFPVSPEDAKGLLKITDRGDDLVIFFKHKRLYGMYGPVAVNDYTIPFGEAKVIKDGKDVTIIGVSRMVFTCLEAA